MCGCEMGNAFTELNDPIDQNERFEASGRKARQQATTRRSMMDEDYVNGSRIRSCLPTGGHGLRHRPSASMFLTDAASIRDVLLFPTMKPLD